MLRPVFLWPCVILWGSMALAAAPAKHASLPLIDGGRVTVTAEDLRRDAERIPSEARSAALSRPDTVLKVASTLYARKAFAAEAVKKRLEKDPQVQTALQHAREKVLADAYLASIDRANLPTAATLERRALEDYRANAKPFEVSEQVQARHILLSKDGTDAKAKAEAVLAELKAGGDFAKIAEKQSIDPGSAPKGGELGAFGRGQMVAPFEEAAFALKQTGDLSEVVESQFGYHIIQLQRRLPAGVKPFEEVKDKLMADVSRKLANEARIRETQSILGKAKINQDAIEAFSATYR